MSAKSNLRIGALNGHAVGRILKEAVRRAMVEAVTQRNIFDVTVKRSYSGKMDDVFTTADRNAQKIYLRTFQECFPNCGVIAEEDKLQIKPKRGCGAYFTVDPIDGTKAYIRAQSHGIGTMVAMVQKGKVIGAYVGDICADEVYGYRPGSSHVFRITRLDAFRELKPPKRRKCSDMYVMLRDPPGTYTSDLARKTIFGFKNHEVIGSSIGTWAARLWKQEVGALMIPPGMETPWDSTPVIGISLRLGYVFLRPSASGKRWVRYKPTLPTKVFKRDHDILIVHENSAKQFLKRN